MLLGLLITPPPGSESRGRLLTIFFPSVPARSFRPSVPTLLALLQKPGGEVYEDYQRRAGGREVRHQRQADRQVCCRPGREGG